MSAVFGEVDGCVKHRRHWERQRYMGRDDRGDHWLLYCPCGIYIGQRWWHDRRRWFTDEPKPGSVYEWARP